MKISFNDEEVSRLQGLPWIARLIYLQALRPYIDYATGVVGSAKRRVSYQSIAEELYVEPIRGRRTTDTGKPTKDAIRNAIDNLIEAGLLKKQTSDSNIVFLLPVADWNKSVQTIYTTSTPPIYTTPAPQEKNSDIIDLGNPSDASTPGVKARSTPHLLESTTTSKSKSKSKDKNIRGTHTNNELVSDRANKSVLCVFSHWVQVMGKENSQLDDKRYQLVAKRLADGYSVDTLMLAIDGCAVSAWHQGNNPRRQKFDDIELILRDASHIEQFLSVTANDNRSSQYWENFEGEDRIIRGEYGHG